MLRRQLNRNDDVCDISLNSSVLFTRSVLYNGLAGDIHVYGIGDFSFERGEDMAVELRSLSECGVRLIQYSYTLAVNFSFLVNQKDNGGYMSDCKEEGCNT
mmetsp:Transcript_30276/g.29171  ORF Transcript_30276/g.29171 Transcript_30276/m.29171 type:complete len:101 (-) Transcript_30276:71-373(-)